MTPKRHVPPADHATEHLFSEATPAPSATSPSPGTLSLLRHFDPLARHGLPAQGRTWNCLLLPALGVHVDSVLMTDAVCVCGCAGGLRPGPGCPCLRLWHAHDRQCTTLGSVGGISPDTQTTVHTMQHTHNKQLHNLQPGWTSQSYPAIGRGSESTGRLTRAERSSGLPSMAHWDP